MNNLVIINNATVIIELNLLDSNNARYTILQTIYMALPLSSSSGLYVSSRNELIFKMLAEHGSTIHLSFTRMYQI